MLAVLCLLIQLPTVQRVLDRNVEATGGRAALLRHTSMTIHGRSDNVETVVYLKGTKGLQKALLPNRNMIKTIARDADMYYHLHVLRYFTSMTVVDVKPFNGHPCYHLKGVNNWGKLNEQFYDTATGILRGYAFNTAWRGGQGDATQTFEDYKSFGGVMMPAKTIGRDGDNVSVDLITSVTYDDVPDSVFAVPQAVRKR